MAVQYSTPNKLTIDGVDISRFVRGAKIKCEIQSVNTVKIEFLITSASVNEQGEIAIATISGDFGQPK